MIITKFWMNQFIHCAKTQKAQNLPQAEAIKHWFIATARQFELHKEHNENVIFTKESALTPGFGA